MSVSVFAPASIGNVSVGFDILGLAVRPIDGTLLGDVVQIKQSHQGESSLTVVGRFSNKLPSDPKLNIVWDCMLLFNKSLLEKRLPVDNIDIVLDKKMPVGSGLGSSACSVVGALHALNEYYQQPFDTMTLLELMGQMEAQISGSLHYDNVAPCYLGGLQLMLADEDNISRTVPFFDDCYWVMAYPGIEVSTKMAREVLPLQYSRQDLIRASQNLATFIDGCHRQDKAQTFNVVTDVVAEPYRDGLIPRFSEAKKAMKDNGALATGISGSGPTLFAVFDDLDQANVMAKWLEDNYLQSELGFVHVCRTDTDGACKLPIPALV